MPLSNDYKFRLQNETVIIIITKGTNIKMDQKHDYLFKEHIKHFYYIHFYTISTNTYTILDVTEKVQYGGRVGKSYSFSEKIREKF